MTLATSHELPIPPFEMRELVGPTDVAEFDNPTRRPILGLDETRFDSVLDFGCGCGRLARQMMMQHARPRRYLGFDLHRGMVRWCQENLSPHAPEFVFVHHDVDNMSFNPGAGKPAVLPMPAEDTAFSLMIAMSVFTHTIEAHAQYYLKEVSRVLRDDGLLVASFFLFDKQYFPMMQDFQNALYINLDDPWSAVILDRGWLELTLRELGLGIVRARAPGVRGHQWLLHIRSVAAGEPFVTLPEDEGPFGRILAPVSRADPSTIE